MAPDGTPPGSGHAADSKASARTGPQSDDDLVVRAGADDGDVGIDDVAGTGCDDGFEHGGDTTGEDASGRDPLRFNRWMRSSASGGILTGIALGLQHALEERREQPAFVMEAPGEPEDPDAPISLHFDPEDPTKTVAVIRAPMHDDRRDGPPPPAHGE